MNKKIYAASVTPFSANDTIDIDSMLNILKRVAAAKCTGSFIFGTMGEWAQITPYERIAVLKAIDVEKNIGEILVGISENSLKMTLLNMPCRQQKHMLMQLTFQPQSQEMRLQHLLQEK